MGGEDKGDSTNGAVVTMSRSTITMLDRPPPPQVPHSASRELLATQRTSSRTTFRWNAMTRSHSWTDAEDILSPCTSDGQSDDEEEPLQQWDEQKYAGTALDDDEDEIDDEDDSEEPWEVADIEEELLRFQMKLGAQSASEPTVNDMDVVDNQQSHRRSTSRGNRLEAKIRSIAQYIKNMSTSMRSPIQTVRRRSRKQMLLSEFPLHRSAPDVLGRTRPVTVPIRLNSSSTMKVVHPQVESSTIQEILKEQAPPTIHERVLGLEDDDRPNRFFSLKELIQCCERCNVPHENINEVVSILAAGFGTHLLDLVLLDDLVGGNIVLLMGMLVFSLVDQQEEFVEFNRLDPFLRHVQTRYPVKNAFHNACHAVDVMHSLFVLFSSTNLGERISVVNQIGALLAAVMHDIEHLGLTNDFLIKTNHPIAQQFPTLAPMEEMHVRIATELLHSAEYGLMAKMTLTQQSEVLQILRSTIRATALVNQHKLLLDMNEMTAEEWNEMRQSNNQVSDSDTDDEEEEDVPGGLPFSLQLLILRNATHVSDIGQTMKPFHIHMKWVDRLNEEHYCQGEIDMRQGMDVSPPFCFRERFAALAFLKCQVGFLRKVALPAVVSLHRVPWMDVQFLVKGIEDNIREWEAQLRIEEACSAESVTLGVPEYAPVVAP